MASPRAVAMRTLRVDAMTAEVVRALGSAGCRSILLKGPSFRRELYDAGSPRPYVDSDLLVSPADLERAGAAVAALGFRMVMDHRDHASVSEPHAQEWERDGRKNLDLHWRIAGVGVPAEDAWETLLAHAVPIAIGGATGETLDRPGLALLVGLHAANHGRARERSLDDLERALERFDAHEWSEAARLAAELGASEAFAAGLRLSEGGSRLAEVLALPAPGSARRRLLHASPPPGSFGLLRILESGTLRERARALRAELLPAPALMRTRDERAARGGAGLAFAYVERVASRAWHLPAAVRAVGRSRRAARG